MAARLSRIIPVSLTLLAAMALSACTSQQAPTMKAGEKRLLEFEFVSPLSSGARYRVDLGYRMPVQGEYVDKVFSAAGFSVVNQGDRIVPLLFDVPGNISVGQMQNENVSS